MSFEDFEEKGWARFPASTASVQWAMAAHQAGCAVLADPVMRDKWLECRGTWFVGVDALPTDAHGAIAGTPLAGPVLDALGVLPDLHPAQLSIVFPGYPQPRAGDSVAAFNYREKRLAAHVDGITPSGPEKRRFVTEPHGFILGLPLNEPMPDAAPLVVWERSHRIIGPALARRFERYSLTDPAQVDVTDIYQSARKDCFDLCEQKRLFARPGEALLLHRHLLHGIAPWDRLAWGPPEGRMIAYFRPLSRGGHAAWASSDSLV